MLSWFLSYQLQQKLLFHFCHKIQVRLFTKKVSKLIIELTICKPGYIEVTKQCFIYRGIHQLSLSESICKANSDKLPSREIVESIVSLLKKPKKSESHSYSAMMKINNEPLIPIEHDRNKPTSGIVYFAKSKFVMTEDGKTPVAVVCQQRSTIISGNN